MRKVNHIYENPYIGRYYLPDMMYGSTELGVNEWPENINMTYYEDFFRVVLDKIVDEDPEYMTKSIIGQDQSGNYNIYRYDMKPKNYKQTMILTGGMHGNEYISFFGLCKLVDTIYRNPDHDPSLEYLKRYTHIVVLPMCNPWGFCNDKRQNSRGVDLNRNFPYGWDKYNTSDATAGNLYYKGESAGSEAETVAIMNIITELSKKEDISAILDFHGSSVDAVKLLYYPRYIDNNMEGIMKVMDIYRSDRIILNPADPTGDTIEDDRTIVSSVNIPNIVCWVTNTFNCTGCMPCWNVTRYNDLGLRTEALMTKYIEYNVNIINQYIQPENSSVGQHYVKSYIWNSIDEICGNEVLVPYSNTLTNVENTVVNEVVDGEYIVKFSGSVTLRIINEATIGIFPRLYQKYSAENNDATVNSQLRNVEYVTLKPGEYILPIEAVLHAHPTCYNFGNSSNTGEVSFRLQMSSNISSSAYMKAYKFNFEYIPVNAGIPVIINKRTQELDVEGNYIDSTVYPMCNMDMKNED